MRIFINGTLDIAETSRSGPLYATSKKMEWGYSTNTGVAYPYHGKLDDVRVYDIALSDTDVDDLSDDIEIVSTRGHDLRYEYHHTNALGSNIVLTDGSENVLVRYEYDVFGAIRHEVGNSDNLRQFTGKEWEADSKLFYFAARYYDPYVGRFTQRDPIGDGLNWYAYAASNPLKFVDPTGTTIGIVSPPDENGGQSFDYALGPNDDGFAQGRSFDTVSDGSKMLIWAVEGNPTGFDSLITHNQSLSETNALGSIVNNLIDNPAYTVLIMFDTRGLLDEDESGWTMDAGSGQIYVFLNPSLSKMDENTYIELRLALSHELTHAHQIITGRFGLDYYTFYTMEYEANNNVARLGAELGTLYRHAVIYVPYDFLPGGRHFSPYVYHYYIHQATMGSVQKAQQKGWVGQ